MNSWCVVSKNSPLSANISLDYPELIILKSDQLVRLEDQLNEARLNAGDYKAQVKDLDAKCKQMISGQ